MLSSTKTCTGCKKTFPRSEEYFVKYTHWQSRCRTCLSQYDKAYHKLNKIKKLEVNRAYERTPEGSYQRYKHGAKYRQISFELTYNEFLMFWQKPCFYGGCAVETIGLDRIDSQSGYHLSNLVSCCSVHNKMKSTMTQEQFLNYCERVVLQMKQGK